MTIDEAIKLIGKLQGETPEQLATPMQQAIKLGIEALNFWKRLKRATDEPQKWLLPGETEEVK